MGTQEQPAASHPFSLYGMGLLFAGACTLIIGVTAYRLTQFTIVGVTEPFQYPWRLVEPTTASRLSAWLGYAAHNLAAWILIAVAKRRSAGYSDKMTDLNWAMLGVHVLFFFLHLAQTHVYYDALAQDVPELTALGSVALMLMVILILENPRRGLFLGKKFPFHKRFLKIARAYHGYLFSWALIYTFWYHPTVDTPGHLVGFFYMFVLLWQSVLFFNRAHLHKGWIIFLEVMVIPHGVLVAYFQGNALWTMFGFGFGAIFILTQMYAFKWSTKTNLFVTIGFVILLVVCYASVGQLKDWHSVFRIPVLDYGVVFLLYGLFWLIHASYQKLKRLPL